VQLAAAAYTRILSLTQNSSNPRQFARRIPLAANNAELATFKKWFVTPPWGITPQARLERSVHMSAFVRIRRRKSV
jgi:hypothetical protein